MKRIVLILMSLFVLADLGNVLADYFQVDVVDVGLNPGLIEMTIPSGRLGHTEIKIINICEMPLQIKGISSPWIDLYPKAAKILNQEKKEFDVFFSIGLGEEPARKGEIIFTAQNDGDIYQEEKIEVNILEPAVEPKIGLKDFEQLKRKIAKQKNEIKKYKVLAKQLDDKTELLQEEVYKLQATGGMSREELNIAFRSLRAGLDEEIANEKVQVEWMNGKILIIVPSVFDSGESEPGKDAAFILKKIGRILKGSAGGNIIEVRAHADVLPISENLKREGVLSNWQLSAMRASTVAYNIFQSGAGIKGKDLLISSCSLYRPLYENRTLEGRYKNRRIEIFVLLP